VTHPALQGVYDVVMPLKGHDAQNMERYLKQCQAR
jgi:hypothetical protein